MNVTQSMEHDPTYQISDYTIIDEDNIDGEDCTEEIYFKYQSMQYSLFTNFGVEIIGGILFFITAIYIVRDKLACENASAGNIKDYFTSVSLFLSLIWMLVPLLSSIISYNRCYH